MLLDINRDLLMEVMRIQALQSEIKKEAEAESNADTKFSERRTQSSKDYGECMRRIQYNLAYLAAVADRSHKPASSIPKYPQFMYAPPLSQTTTYFNFSSPMMTNATAPKSENQDSPGSAVKAEADIRIEKESRISSLKENYQKLQDLFNVTETDVMKEIEHMQAQGRMQAQQQNKQSHQMYSQNPQQQSPITGGNQRLPSQQMTPNLLQNNMSSQMQGQGPSQQSMNLAMGSAMGMAGMGPINMSSQAEMGFQRGLPGGGMQR